MRTPSNIYDLMNVSGKEHLMVSLVGALFLVEQLTNTVGWHRRRKYFAVDRQTTLLRYIMIHLTAQHKSVCGMKTIKVTQIDSSQLEELET